MIKSGFKKFVLLFQNENGMQLKIHNKKVDEKSFFNANRFILKINR